MPVLPTPTVPFINPITGLIDTQWENWQLSLSSLAGVALPPIDAPYWVSASNLTLTNDVNLGALVTGLLFLTVAAGTATPSTLALLTLALGGTGADLSATGGASRVLRQSSTGAAVTVSQLAAADLSDVAASTYTPTLTNVTNLAASTPYACQYLRVGATVTVSGLVDVDPTAAGATELGVSLPVASNFGAVEQCAGVAFCVAVAGFGAAIEADAANNRAAFKWVAVDIANQTLSWSFTYRII